MAELEKILCTDSRIEAAKKINAIVDAMGEGDLANIDLSNLSSTGQAKFDEKAYANEVLKKSQITNCLLEVPQNIKLELADGVLTLKAGSKVIVPNGAGVFEEVVISNDINRTMGSTTLGEVFIYVKHGLAGSAYLGERSISRSTSGTTNPATTQALWYDTTNNKVMSSVSDTTFTDDCSFPVAIVNYTTRTIVQVFNGFGYIGSTVWVDKGVKGLIPDGRNEDGTLRNIEVTTDKVLTYTNPSSNVERLLLLSTTSIRGTMVKEYYEQTQQPNTTASGAAWMNPSTNLFKYYDVSNQQWVTDTVLVCGVFVVEDKQQITSLQPKLPVRLLTADDIKINNPYFFGQYIWSEFAPSNLSWLKSSGQWNSGSGYQGFYDWALANANANKAGFKLSTASYTDYDFVVNTSAKTFRLPVKVQNTPLNDSASVVGNGLALGLNSGTVNFGMVLDNGSSHNYEIFKTGAYGASTQGTAYGNAVATPADYPIGVTTDPTKSGLVANLSANTNVSLYFYVGETTRDTGLINASQIASNFADKVDAQQASGAGMPSNKRTWLTLGASDTTYTMPANGWLVFGKRLGVANTTLYMQLYNNSNGFNLVNAHKGDATTEINLFMPVSKGDSIRVSYTLTGDTTVFVFVYAEGEV